MRLFQIKEWFDAKQNPPSGSEPTGDGQKKRRILDAKENAILQEAFQRNNFISSEERSTLAERLHMTSTQVWCDDINQYSMYYLLLTHPNLKH